MRVLGSSVALGLSVFGAFVTLVGLVWITQVLFEASYDTKDSTWTVVGLLILTTGVLSTFIGVLVRSALRRASQRKPSPLR